MIYREYILLLLLIHIVGDFYVQTPAMAEKKLHDLKWVVIHCISYGCAAIVISLPVISGEIVLLGILMAVSHMVIDILKYCFIARVDRKMSIYLDQKIFYTDQVLHVICLVILAYIFAVNSDGLYVHAVIADFFAVSGVSAVAVVSWLAVLLIIHKPANILISKMLMSYKPEDEDKDIEHDRNAGRFIGTVERLIILIFISLEQYAAIGLVLTAKSIARYDKIISKPSFAEYYLLGTLLSTAAAIITSFVLY